jgi:vanillate O-demethylase ferredoxin subunit
MPPNPTLQRVRVLLRRTEAQDICGLDLAAADGGALAPFTAGAHVDVHLPGGLLRQYSLCNDPEDHARYRLAVLQEPASRGGSRAVFGLQVGDELSVSEPRNHFPLAASAVRSLLIAGGIGITPLLAMAHALHRADAPFTLHYCARSRQRAAFLDELGARFGSAALLHFDDGPEPQRFVVAQVLGAPRAGEHVYVCGPAGFIDHVLSAARELGWPEAQLHSERFSADAPQVQEGDQPFEVEVASNGLVVPVAVGQSIAEALLERGVEVPTSCEGGVCGTCVVRVLRGTPDHRDTYLTDAEHAEQLITTCCSRARSARLVLDL